METTALRTTDVRREASSLLKLGLAFTASGFLMMGAAYVARVVVLRYAGLHAAGLYQCAWTIGGLYVAFVLQAMGADFYPRLVARSKDDGACNRLVNEQAKVSLLLAGSGVMATLTFAPLAISWLYSSEFLASVEILRWICLGMCLRVFTWPMGFIVVAKGRQAIFFATEFAWTAVNLFLTWLCVRAFGLSGAGIAFLASYVFHALLIYPIVRKLSGFRWSAENRALVVSLASSIALVFCGFYVLPPAWATCMGAAATLLSGIMSTRRLLKLASLESVPGSVQRALGRLRVKASRL